MRERDAGTASSKQMAYRCHDFPSYLSSQNDVPDDSIPTELYNKFLNKDAINSFFQYSEDNNLAGSTILNYCRDISSLLTCLKIDSGFHLSDIQKGAKLSTRIDILAVKKKKYQQTKTEEHRSNSVEKLQAIREWIHPKDAVESFRSALHENEKYFWLNILFNHRRVVENSCIFRRVVRNSKRGTTITKTEYKNSLEFALFWAVTQIPVFCPRQGSLQQLTMDCWREVREDPEHMIVSGCFKTASTYKYFQYDFIIFEWSQHIGCLDMKSYHSTKQVLKFWTTGLGTSALSVI